MPAIHPLVADNWIYRTLVAVPAVTAFCAGRITAAREGFEPEEFLTPDEKEGGKTEADCWPWISYGNEDSRFEHCGPELVLQPGEYRIVSYMREDLAPQGFDFEDFNATGYLAIMEALEGVSDPDGLTGTVHECHILRPWRRLYGERGQRISEWGIIARITTT